MSLLRATSLPVYMNQRLRQILINGKALVSKGQGIKQTLVTSGGDIPSDELRVRDFPSDEFRISNDEGGDDRLRRRSLAVKITTSSDSHSLLDLAWWVFKVSDFDAMVPGFEDRFLPFGGGLSVGTEAEDVDLGGVCNWMTWALERLREGPKDDPRAPPRIIGVISFIGDERTGMMSKSGLESRSGNAEDINVDLRGFDEWDRGGEERERDVCNVTEGGETERRGEKPLSGELEGGGSA